MQAKELRHTELIYLPTKRWLRRRNPKGKIEILNWYKNEKKLLNKRRFRKVIVTLEANTAQQDRDTKKLYKKSRYPEDFPVELWRLSEQDYNAYLGSLNRQFTEMKRKHNEKVKAKRIKDKNQD